MDAGKIIALSDLKEDFVILWRWNHTPLLERYAGQIVSQSKLLKAFLAKLEGANKRAALIIDKEGGERITFTLSKPQDAEHQRMGGQKPFRNLILRLAVVGLELLPK